MNVLMNNFISIKSINGNYLVIKENSAKNNSLFLSDYTITR